MVLLYDLIVFFIISKDMSLSKSVTDYINYVKENPHYSASFCPWHYDNYCFILTTNSDNKRFHCLYDKHSTKWVSYNSSQSCDIPEYFFDLIKLNEKLGSEYVLPFITHFREISGYTIGLYEIKSGLYNANILKSDYLFETFLTFIVLQSEICLLYGGFCPQMNRLKFIYTETHPVLVDIGKKNWEEREKIKHLNKFNMKKWKSFMDKRTIKDVFHYVKISHPNFFKKKSTQTQSCLLSDKHNFSPDTHDLICHNIKSSYRNILTKYKEHIPSLKSKIDIILKYDVHEINN